MSSYDPIYVIKQNLNLHNFFDYIYNMLPQAQNQSLNLYKFSKTKLKYNYKILVYTDKK